MGEKSEESVARLGKHADKLRRLVLDINEETWNRVEALADVVVAALLNELKIALRAEPVTDSFKVAVPLDKYLSSQQLESCPLAVLALQIKTDWEEIVAGAEVDDQLFSCNDQVDWDVDSATITIGVVLRDEVAVRSKSELTRRQP